MTGRLARYACSPSSHTWLGGEARRAVRQTDPVKVAEGPHGTGGEGVYRRSRYDRPPPRRGQIGTIWAEGSDRPPSRPYSASPALASTSGSRSPSGV